MKVFIKLSRIRFLNVSYLFIGDFMLKTEKQVVTYDFRLECKSVTRLDNFFFSKQETQSYPSIIS